MSFMELIDALRAYGVDVLLLALGVTLLVALLKKTVMKNVPKKVFVVLPFAIGIVLYAIFRALVSLSPEPFTSEIASTLEKGFACGCCSTLYYVIYEQFIRGRSVSPLYPLLGGECALQREQGASRRGEGTVLQGKLEYLFRPTHVRGRALESCFYPRGISLLDPKKVTVFPPRGVPPAGRFSFPRIFA